MNILIACECSCITRDAFLNRGHRAISCDLNLSKSSKCLVRRENSNDFYDSNHIVDNVLNHLKGWDLIIAFPPCTYLCNSGARWRQNNFNKQKQREAIEFVDAIWSAPCPRVCIENPMGILSTQWRPYSQIIHPWQFGHVDKKQTCLWLRGLSKLVPTQIIPKEQRKDSIYLMQRSAKRAELRSKSFSGIAQAMSIQWG